jgi:type III restriction enzyme
MTSLSIKEESFVFPKEMLFTFDSNQKLQRVYKKSIYKGYLSSAEIRSNSEKRFEKYCENSDNVKWIFKNGDKGLDYFSIVYVDAFNKQKLFYPDYILMDNDNNIWIIETKGGFTKSGKSEDIDKFSPFKFVVLRNYLSEKVLKGGFVRLDKSSDELCICTDEYSENIESANWKLLSEVL